MTVTDVVKDPEALRLSIVSELAAPIERAWQLWEDPRQLERWWGPPTYPATFVDHELRAGGIVTYFMTSPEGEKYHGWWRVRSVDPPRSLAVEDGFGSPDDEPNPDLPVTSMEVTLEELDAGRTRMVIASQFPSAEAMQKILDMGAAEGMAAALGQIDDILG